MMVVVVKENNDHVSTISIKIRRFVMNIFHSFTKAISLEQPKEAMKVDCIASHQTLSNCNRPMMQHNMPGINQNQ